MHEQLLLNNIHILDTVLLNLKFLYTFLKETFGFLQKIL